MHWPIPTTVATTIIHWLIVAALSLRIVSRRRPTGVSLAWITVIAVFPFVGAILYLMVGELWLAGRRVCRAHEVGDEFRGRLAELAEQAPAGLENYSHLARTLDAYARRGASMPTLGCNEVNLYAGADEVFDALIADIDAARHRVYLMFYIWSKGGRADEVGEAVIRAAGRGVDCRILLDAVGSKRLLRRSPWPRRFADAGIPVVAALKAGRLRVLLHRIDLRNHRKIAAIDGKIGYCGSQNIADPRYFKTDAGVGPWVDVMCRINGPAGEALELTFQHDWCIEAECIAPRVFVDIDPAPHTPGGSPLQVINSGPAQSPRATEDMLLTMIFASQQSLVMTTPYFIPTESMEHALIAAALRGVAVQIVVPAKNDSRLVALASRSYYGDLLDAGVRIWEFEGGLLHAKTVTADGRVGLIGSANMDRRSFAINYETSVFIYDSQVAERLGKLQSQYMEQAIEVVAVEWAKRSRGRRLVENATQLVSPIL
jgi:cardiolipin synthase A/B